jgi:hypothetical protein
VSDLERSHGQDIFPGDPLVSQMLEVRPLYVHRKVHHWDGEAGAPGFRIWECIGAFTVDVRES